MAADSEMFGTEKISRILLRIAPPVMLAQLIQALYNIVDSFFVGKFSETGLTALSCYPEDVRRIYVLGIPNILMQSAYTFYILGLNLILAGFSDQAVTALGLMAIGTLCFELIPAPMLRVFTKDPEVVSIGAYGFHLIGISFLPMVTSLIFPVFFQALGQALKSSLLTVIRTVVLFVPLGFLFSRWGLHSFWLTFPVTETITSLVGLFFYRQFMKTKK